MLFFVTTTQKCNLACTYCGNDENMEDFEDLDIKELEETLHPAEVQFNIEHLKQLALCKDELIICFYGGEPLLRREIVYKVIDLLPEKTKYVLQTNGTQLLNVNVDYLFKFTTILVSIDGDQRTTDKNRGRGTYLNITKNVRHIRSIGFKGDLIARMTCSEACDVYESVKHLLQVGLFDHVHWQIDCLWDSDMNSRWIDFVKWRDELYLPGVTKLTDYFIKELQEGKLLGIAPFLGILYSLLIKEERCGLRCKSGLSSFSVQTGGKITTCPIAAETEPVARLDEKFDPESVRDIEHVGEPCVSCYDYKLCGGRCLYTNKSKWWGVDGFYLVCKTVHHLISEMKRIFPIVEQLVNDNKFKIEDFHYPPFDNSVEVIP